MLPYFGILAVVATHLLSDATVITHNLDSDSDRPEHKIADPSKDQRIFFHKFNDIKNLTSVAALHEGMLATQKEGKLYYIDKDKNETVVKDYAKDLKGAFTSEKECGLLSVAYDEKHYPADVFITYTVNAESIEGSTNDMYVARYRFSIEEGKITLAPISQSIFVQSFVEYIHHAGTLVFDSKGRLYISIGDGGPQGDPEGHGQSLESYRGKLLRIYPNKTPEIIVYGLRNPWKYSIVHNSAYIGNVGHNTTESIVYIPSLDDGPYNAGWNLYEGSLPYEGAPRKPTKKESRELLRPIFEYPTDAKSETTPGRAVIGGYIVPGKENLYIFSDNISAYVYILQHRGGEWLQIAKKKLPSNAHPYSLGLVHSNLFALTTKGIYTITIV